MPDTLNQSVDLDLIAVARVEGVAVYDVRAEKLGVIKDVYIDKRSGQAQFVSLASGGVLGMGEKHHALPWAALTFDSALNGFLVALEKATLDSSPAFEDAELAGEETDWADLVRTFYGPLKPAQPAGGRHFTHGTSASTADMAVGEVRHEDKAAHVPHARPIDPPAEGETVDQLAEKLERGEGREEARLDEGLEESFPASDPVSAKHIT